MLYGHNDKPRSYSILSNIGLEIGSKLWKVFFENKDPHLGFPDNTRWDLLKRATAAESKIEAILVKLATERKLSKADLKNLGLFRQAYQQLRESIRDNEPLDFGSYGPEYNYYNDLASNVACRANAL